MPATTSTRGHAVAAATGVRSDPPPADELEDARKGVIGDRCALPHDLAAFERLLVVVVGVLVLFTRRRMGSRKL